MKLTSWSPWVYCKSWEACASPLFRSFFSQLVKLSSSSSWFTKRWLQRKTRETCGLLQTHPRCQCAQEQGLYRDATFFSLWWSGVCHTFQRKWNSDHKECLDGLFLTSTMDQTEWWVLFYELWNTKKNVDKKILDSIFVIKCRSN